MLTMPWDEMLLFLAAGQEIEAENGVSALRDVLDAVLGRDGET